MLGRRPHSPAISCLNHHCTIYLIQSNEQNVSDILLTQSEKHYSREIAFA